MFDTQQYNFEFIIINLNNLFFNVGYDDKIMDYDIRDEVITTTCINDNAIETKNELLLFANYYMEHKHNIKYYLNASSKNIEYYKHSSNSNVHIAHINNDKIVKYEINNEEEFEDCIHITKMIYDCVRRILYYIKYGY